MFQLVFDMPPFQVSCCSCTPVKDNAYFFGQENSRDRRIFYLLTFSCCSCTPVKDNAYFPGQENSRDSRCIGLSLICRHFRSPVAPVLLSKTMRIFRTGEQNYK